MKVSTEHEGSNKGQNQYIKQALKADKWVKLRHSGMNISCMWVTMGF